jgi:NAD(P)-dependent dehydrogenase (short-subunit alcohol dehydrogenase family)
MNATPTPPSFDLADRVVLLTGGAGLYGQDLARHLLAAGATVVLASRNHEELQRFAGSIGESRGRLRIETFDQGDEASILALRDTIVRDFGRVDGLVNNAVARPVRSIDSPLSDWQASMRVNASGLFAITRAFGALMCERRSGSIVNIGSIQGMVGPDLSLYAGLAMHAVPDYFFHKAGLVNLTRYFAAHYGPHNVRVNCVSPGGLFSGQDPQFVARYEQATYLRRMAGPGDLGGPVVFLLSEAARYVTGVNLPVDGGYTAH